MPSAYPDRGAIKMAILARLAAGETLVGICAEPGMPDRQTIYHWTRAPGDDWFGPALKQATAVGAHLRRTRQDEAIAQEFLRRFASGETRAQLSRDAGRLAPLPRILRRKLCPHLPHPPEGSGRGGRPPPLPAV